MKDDILIAKIRKRHNLPDSADVRVKSVAADIKAKDDDSYKFSATITRDMLDRDREVVIPDGVDTSEFDKSGAVFWNHNYDMPVAIPTGIKKRQGAIDSTATFMKRPSGHQGEWFPDFARAFVTQGAELGKAVGVSIGFIPTEMRDPSDKDRQRFGDEVINIISKSKLLEWSIAPVQSNPGAVVTAVGKGLLSTSAAKAMFDVEVANAETKRKKVYVIIEDAKSYKPLPVPRKAAPTADILVHRAIIKAKGGLYHE